MTYRYTLAETQEAYLAYQNAMWSPRGRAVASLCFGVAMICTLVQVLRSGLSPGPLLGLICGLGWFVGVPALLRWFPRWKYAKLPWKDATIEWRFTDESVEQTTSIGQAISTWAVVTKVVKTPKGYLVFAPSSPPCWVPLHAFAGPAEIAMFESLVMDKVPKFKEAPWAK